MPRSTNHIRAFRVRQKLSTTELGYRLGIHQSSVVRLEQSEARKSISLRSLERAARALGCSLMYRFVPVEPVSAKDALIHTVTNCRRVSRISEALRRDDLQLVRQLSARNRLRRAFELSDFARRLNQCSKKS